MTLTAVFLKNHGAGAALTGNRTFTTTPSVGTSRLRVSVNIGIDEGTLERFAVRLAAALKEAGICSAASS